MLSAPINESNERLGPTRTLAAPEPQRTLHPRYPGACGLDCGLGEGARLAPRSGAAQLRRKVAGLHRTVGNQAVLRMLSRLTPAIQAKLTVNQPGDQYEQEADRVAEQVMRMPESDFAPKLRSTSGEPPGVQRKCACGGSGGECEACKEKREEGVLQRKSAGHSVPGQAPAIVREALRVPGQPLEQSTRSFMESRFGHDFRQVRVSADDTSAKAADAIKAKAFTYGNRIVFGRNEYNPSSAPGLGLIAHELAHAAQQGSAAPLLQASLRVGAIDDPQEREADVAANAILGAGRIPSLSAGAATIRRAPNDGYSWEWKGKDQGLYTSAAGAKYTVTRKYKPVTKSKPTQVTPGLDFARGYITVKWCKGQTQGTAQVGVDITDQLQQLIPDMLSSGNPKQVLENATATPFVNVEITRSEKWQVGFDVEADVGRQGVTGVRVGGHVPTPIGEVQGTVGVDLPPGGHVTPTVDLRVTPGKKSVPEVKCETTIFEEEYECSQVVTTPARDVPITIDLPWAPRTHNLYFDYARHIVTSSSNEYGKKHPEVVARNQANFAEISKDIGEGFRVSAVEGFTSPEGPMPEGQGGFEGNTALAKERAIEALDYIAREGRCSILIESMCFSPSMQAIRAAIEQNSNSNPSAVKGELYTGFDEKGKELEGKKLAETAVPGFKKAEESTLTDKEREALAPGHGALAQAEVVYPLLRRAEIRLERAGKRPVELWKEHYAESKSSQTVDCPAEVKQAAKDEFA